MIEPTRVAHPLLIAHRGASGYRPEHTRAAYELAIDLGADAIEPDIVATRDGELVLRHENEIGGTTDVAAHPEFAKRRTTKRVDGVSVTGWFTEDFTWAELATLRSRERIPALRPHSARFDGRYPILRLRDLLGLLDAAPRPIALVAELKHPTYFAALGLPLDTLFAAEVKQWRARGGTAELIVESFEQAVLGQLQAGGLDARYVYLHERKGSAADLVARHGRRAPSWATQRSNAGLSALADDGIDGLSVESTVLTADLVNRAHDRGLEVFTWTLRPENRFLPEAYRIGSAKAAHGDWLAHFTELMRTGVDGVFADHPDLAREARATVRGAT